MPDSEYQIRWEIAQMMDELAIMTPTDQSWESIYKEARRRIFNGDEDDD